MFDRSDAEVIIEAHEIRELMANEEERQLLLANNPDLLIAYEALLRFAKS